MDADVQATSIGIIAHECAHVQITMEKELAIPEARLGTRINGYERALMFQLAEVFWDEYAACRLSAPLATRHSPLATRHSPLATRHSPLATRHSPLATRHQAERHPRVNGGGMRERRTPPVRCSDPILPRAR